MRSWLALLGVTVVSLEAGVSPTQAMAGQLPQPEPTQSGVVGHWLGALEVPGARLRLLFEISEDEGAFSATLVSLDQGNAQIPVESVTVNGNQLSLAMPGIGATFTGELSEGGDTISGTFTQGGQPLPLELERTSPESAEEASTRPQDPKEPLPYHAEDVSYPNPDGGHTLAGTFTRPTDGGPFPAVVLISGSGPQDRNEALLGHRPFLVLSDHLTRAGIAVLRFDDRGVAESTGDFESATSADFATDALAGVAYLKTRPDVDPARIGLAGHSEGGLIAPIAAVQSEDVSYIVLMAGPGVNGEEILYAQGELIGRASGSSEEELQKSMQQQREIYEILKEEDDNETRNALVEEYVRAALAEATEEELAQQGITDEASQEAATLAQTESLTSPWFRYFLTLEPSEALTRVTVPVLAINGELDLQVPVEQNLNAIEAALQAGGNTNYEIHALPGHNHLFQHAETGAPSEYQEIEETWSVESMELIANWILKTVGMAPVS